MELTVHGKQLDVGDALRTHVKDKLTDVSEKYFNHTTYATVTFSKEGHGHPQLSRPGKNLGNFLLVTTFLQQHTTTPFYNSCSLFNGFNNTKKKHH